MKIARANLLRALLFVLVVGCVVLLYLSRDQNGQTTKIATLKVDSGKTLSLQFQVGSPAIPQPINSATDLQNSAASQSRTSNSSALDMLVNVDWKAKNIVLNDGRTVAYRFGEGNPSESSPLTSDEISAYESCGGDGHPNLFTGCPADGYITRDVELALKDLLSFPKWRELLSNCEADFRQRDKTLDFGDLHYYDLVAPGYFDIEQWMLVDLNTGRKVLRRFQETKAWFYTNVGEDDNGYIIKKCLLEHGGFDLYKRFEVLENKLYTPS